MLRWIAILALTCVASTAAAKAVPCPSTCKPPATFVSTLSPVPFNAPVRFDAEVKMGGGVMWRWIKTGEPPRPCTEEQQADASDRYGCNAKIGDVLYLTPRFRVVAD